MDKEAEGKIKELEERVKHLEERVEMLIHIADMDKHPFTYSALEHGLTKQQVTRILDLMDRARKSIKEDKPMNHSVFEQAVYEIVPSKRGDYHFAEEVVSTLNEEGRWKEVYAHMKKNGMNI